MQIIDILFQGKLSGMSIQDIMKKVGTFIERDFLRRVVAAEAAANGENIWKHRKHRIFVIFILFFLSSTFLFKSLYFYNNYI